MRSFLLGTAIIAATSLPAMAQTVASVNGTAITEAMIADALKGVPEKLLLAQGDELRKRVINQLVEQELLFQEAEKNEMEQDISFQRNLKTLKRRLMTTTLIEQHVEDAITPELIESEYNRIAEDLAQPAVRARHILVKTRLEAEALIKKLDDGADFAVLAKESSTGPSGPSGGDLGWFGRSDMVEPFADVAFNLVAGAYSKEPVETQFGWHVVKVEEREEAKKPTFEELRPNLQEALQQQVVINYLRELKENASIIYADDAEKTE